MNEKLVDMRELEALQQLVAVTAEREELIDDLNIIATEIGAEARCNSVVTAIHDLRSQLAEARQHSAWQDEQIKALLDQRNKAEAQLAAAVEAMKKALSDVVAADDALGCDKRHIPCCDTHARLSSAFLFLHSIYNIPQAAEAYTQRVERLEGALRFYAEGKHYGKDNPPKDMMWHCSNAVSVPLASGGRLFLEDGIKAREALNQEGEQP